MDNRYVWEDGTAFNSIFSSWDGQFWKKRRHCFKNYFHDIASFFLSFILKLTKASADTLINYFSAKNIIIILFLYKWLFSGTHCPCILLVFRRSWSRVVYLLQSLFSLLECSFFMSFLVVHSLSGALRGQCFCIMAIPRYPRMYFSSRHI